MTKIRISIDPKVLNAILEATRTDLINYGHDEDDNYYGAKAEDVEKAIHELKAKLAKR